MTGQDMHLLAQRLWPLHRSITGNGLRKSLQIIGEHLPNISIHEVPTGTKVFDWEVPQEWGIRSARITDPNGKVVVDYSWNNLHVVGYSMPVDTTLSLEELQQHLHSIPEQPSAVPYVTSYYNPVWGFCLSHEDRGKLVPGEYRVQIDSDQFPGNLTYGELVIPGESKDEIFISTYICHPSMANNELSGPVVSTAIAQYVQQMTDRHYTYRFAFTPETIGAITFASSRVTQLRSQVIAAFNLTCIGDDRAFTYLASRNGNLRIDRIAQRVIRSRENVREYSYLERGSDERHYGAPGLDLPMISLMRTRYADYPEYHTSLDDLVNVVTPSGLQGGFDLVRECIDYLEQTPVLTASQIAEPQLGRRGLYHLLQKKSTPDDVMLRTNILAYSDGEHDSMDIAELVDRDIVKVKAHIQELLKHKLIFEGHQTNELTIGNC